MSLGYRRAGTFEPWPMQELARDLTLFAVSGVECQMGSNTFKTCGTSISATERLATTGARAARLTLATACDACLSGDNPPTLRGWHFCR